MHAAASPNPFRFASGFSQPTGMGMGALALAGVLSDAGLTPSRALG